MRTIRYFHGFAKIYCENVCLWYSNKKLFAMEYTIQTAPLGVLAPTFAIEALKGVTVQAKRVKNRYLVRIDDVVEKIPRIKEFWCHLKKEGKKSRTCFVFPVN